MTHKSLISQQEFERQKQDIMYFATIDLAKAQVTGAEVALKTL
jgi:hypothetical protein